MTEAEAREERLRRDLAAIGVIGPDEHPAVTALSGGVSSDVFRVDLATGPVCAKQALARLRVKADWRAPVERSDYEAEWLRVAAGVPGVQAPKVLAHDAERHLLVMSWFEPTDHPLWKTELAAGLVDADFASSVGRAVGAMHAATAADPTIADRFRTDALFEALRIEPFLRAPQAQHPDLAPRLNALAERTAATRLALAHGDVSPKNILIGPDGPVFLDAECAWWGDPAFDLAFVSTHLLLKAVWRPASAAKLRAAAGALSEAYLQQVSWERAESLAARAASLTPALLLARVDGRSPVEYLNEGERRSVRAAARRLIAEPPCDMEALIEAWTRESLAA